MRKALLGLLGVAGAGAMLVAGHHATRAADHNDSPAAIASCDIADVYTWMTPNADSLVLAMSLPAGLSDSCQYVFHVGSMAAFGAPGSVNTTILCQYENSQIACWVGKPDTPQGGESQAYVSGAQDATLESEDGNLKVFAGLRDDPFFFNLVGFQKVVEAVVEAAPTLTPDVNGCPAVPADTSAALVAQLAQDADGNPAVDSFAGANTTAIVIDVKKSLVNNGGPILAVWGSTRTR